MSSFHGIIVFEILDNGNVLILNGIYATSDDFKISNEIAKREIIEGDKKDIVGNYESRYIETLGEPDKAINCLLKIDKTPGKEVYEFEWTNNEELHQIGIGIKINSNRIAVSYINA